MDDLEKIQDEIQRLAYEYFQHMEFSEGFSCPLIPRVSEDYLKNRIVIMGQETNTWWNMIYSDHDIKEWCAGKCLNEGYDKFVRECVVSYGGKFWEFSRSLYKEVLKGPICNGNALSHCWMNLFCIEKCVCRNDNNPKHKPSQNRKLAKRVMNVQRDFVYEVMKLIRPKIILAMIGNKNDDLFKKFVLGTECVDEKQIECAETFGELRTTEFKEFEVRDAMNPLYGTMILRTYHPSYFMGRMRGKERKELYKNLIYEKIRASIKK